MCWTDLEDANPPECVEEEFRKFIGSGAIVGPGVTVGKNSVIGTGSVVTKDIPASVVAVGNPRRVLREIGDHDKKYYFRGREVRPEDYEAS